MRRSQNNQKRQTTSGLTPLVSVVTPNYNGSKFIAKTIQSVLDQDYKNIEHIIIDDGSSDQSLIIIKKFQQKYPSRIKVIPQPNRGQSAAVNVGFKKAQGEIVGWINSDDTYCEGAVSAIVNAYLSNKGNKAVVFGDLNVTDEDGKIIKKMWQLPMDLTSGSLIGFGQIVASNTLFWKKELFGKVGYLKEDFDYNMDGEYFSRLFRTADSLHINKFIANFRVHSTAKSSDKSSEATSRKCYELEFEKIRSYANLPISKLIPFRFSFPLRLIFKTKRVILRLFSKLISFQHPS